MGEASIEPLLQITATIPDNGLASTERGRSDRPDFEDHLRNVGSPPRGKTRPSPAEERPAGNVSAVPKRGEATRPPESENASPERVVSQKQATTDPQAVSIDEFGNAIEQESTSDERASYDAAVLAATGATALSTLPSDIAAELPAGEENDVVDAVVTADTLPTIKTVQQATPQIGDAVPLTQQPIEAIQTIQSTPQPIDAIQQLQTAFEDPLDAASSGDEALPSREDQTKVGESDPRVPNANLTVDLEGDVAAEKSPSAENTQKSVTPIAGPQANQVAIRVVSTQFEAQTSKAKTQSDGDTSAAMLGASNTEASAPDNAPQGIPAIADSLTANAQFDGSTAAQSATAPTEQAEKVASREPSREPTEAPAKTDAARTDGLFNSLTRLQRATVTGAERNGHDEMPRVDAARFVSRVAKAFHAAQDRQGPLQLRLSPPELGALHLELTIKDGALTAALETESPTAKRVLLEHLPALRDRLAEQNIRIERFDVDVRRDGGGQQQSGPHDQRQLQQEIEDARAARASSRQLATAPRRVDEPQMVPTSASPDAGLNLVI